MHIEILVEDASGGKLMCSLIPKIIGGYADPHTWRLHTYRGVGQLPKNISASGDPSKRILLDQLPRILRGYGKTSGIDAVIVVLDADGRNSEIFLNELNILAESCNRYSTTIFGLAIEEIEAWYFGDELALRSAYPKAKSEIISRYTQDSVCGTWELLADAIHPGGSAAIKSVGWPLPGQIKCEWADKIAPLLDPDRNISPSFRNFRDSLCCLVGEAI